MNKNNEEVSVYGLVTELCKRFIDKHGPVEHPYLPKKDDSGKLRELRSRAFEILLKKSPSKLVDSEHRDVDPIVELLKYTFVLKSALRRFSRAEELESSLNELCDGVENLDDSLYDILRFLNSLKSFEAKEDENALDVFHYGRPNPFLPEEPKSSRQVPRYQVYPTEMFSMPERFEASLGMINDFHFADDSAQPGECITFENQLKSSTTIGIESLSTRSERTSRSMLSAPRYTVRLVSTREFSISSYFMPQPMDDTDDRSTINIGSLPDPEPPWLCVKSARKNYETCSEISDLQSTNAIGCDDKREIYGDNRLEIFEDIIDYTSPREHRTWEKLGRYEATREAPFVTETSEAMLHLERIKQAGFVLLLPSNVSGTFSAIAEVDSAKFFENIKLLLLGVESSTFVWNDKIGFYLARNTTIRGLSPDSVKSASRDTAYWGGCYKNLCKFVIPDPQTGKMRHEGLIFRAMASSVKEFLLYYQAAVSRITIESDEKQGLLSLLAKVRPVGELMAEVARLCNCDRSKNEKNDDDEDDDKLGIGIGILSHIYERATRTTRPCVSHVFYSILKSCCEVYFRMLEKWLFEGICDDEYGEFMIKIRPRYAREKGHGYWTKAYAINRNSVPGFIGDITDTIMQCGKTVRLLKLCDSNNSLTRIFENEHPRLRVCLTVGMVREQESMCRDYALIGEKSLGPDDISFASAFDEKKRAERERAELVMRAQRSTLLRIKRERESARSSVARKKREFLAELKDQAEEAACRKEREREAEFMIERRCIIEANAADMIERAAISAAKQNTLDYYNELAAEAAKRRDRLDWRNRRMRFFHERSSLIEDTTRRENAARFNEQRENTKIDADTIVVCANVGEIANKNLSKNYDSSDAKLSKISEETSLSRDATSENSAGIVAKKSPRPCVLDIKKSTMNHCVEKSMNLNVCHVTRRGDENTNDMTEITKDMMKITKIRGEYVDNDESRINNHESLRTQCEITPNNNELNIIVVDREGNENAITIDPATISNENIRKTCDNARYDNCDDKKIEINEKIWNIATNDNEIVASKIEIVEMTEARKNREKNMSHTYRDICDERRVSPIMTDLARNRAKIMGHDSRNYRDYAETNVIQCFAADATTPNERRIDDFTCNLTPMSCTTDTFTISIAETNGENFNIDSLIETPIATSWNNAETPNDEFPEKISNVNFNNDTYTKFFGLATITKSSSFDSSSLTIDDVAMIDNTSLKSYLEKSVLTPLRVQSRLANFAIVKYLIYDCKMLSHLHSLRSFFFLLNGEFAKSLTNSLYSRLYEITTPIDLFRTSTLANFLKQALNNSLSTSYENSERLSLSANEIPELLRVSNPEYLNSVCLNYAISWPLNIIIDDKILQQYSKVFKFLLMVGRVLYVLQEDFHILKIDRKSTLTSRYHRLQLYRHSMMQFVTALHNYLTRSVLHESWTEFEAELVNATTIDEIYLTHVNYVKKILSRCMLTSRGEKMRTFLCNIFRVILKFHNRVKSQNWSSSSGGGGGNSRHCKRENFVKLENMYATFCDARAYLAHVADKLASSGYQPHLTHFLNALNINPLYDLKSTRSSERA